jgi:ectoine hydroxylase-related dioxygenase (phytanoyl-CoA dioxygenase family)
MRLDLQALRAQYDALGFALVEDLFSRDEVDEFVVVLDDAIRRRNAEEPRPIEERATLNRQLTHCFNLWEESESAKAIAFDPRLCEIAAALLEASAIRLFLDQIFFKDPGSEPTSRHQDITRWPVRGRFLTAWLALDDVTLESGALAYVPGSHAVGPSSWSDLVHGRRWSAQQMELIEQEPVFVPAKRGSVLFHHSCVFHLAGPNQTERRRRAYTVAYADDGAVRSSSFPFPALDWDNIKVGDPLMGPRTPVVWPRGDGILPSSPPSPPKEFPGWPAPR